MSTPDYDGEDFDPQDPAWDSSYVTPEQMDRMDDLERRWADVGCDVWGNDKDGKLDKILGAGSNPKNK